MASDVFVDVNAIFEGDVKLGDRVRIGPNCIIRNAQIGDDIEMQANCVIDRATRRRSMHRRAVRAPASWNDARAQPLTSAISSRSRTPRWAMAARRTT